MDSQDTVVPTSQEFAGFADAMSTSYGAPVELVSIDPYNDQQTELADTSVTNLLAELPVLEAQANGVTLGLQLADGTQVQFANTARLATWLYSVAVQQGEATQFVTDNYNLDMQWLRTVDQPLLDEADYWSERATAEASSNKEASIEDNYQASMAMTIASEAPGSRQDMEVTIKNASTGNPTQITVYASGDGSSIHDVAPSVLSYVEAAVSTAVAIAAVVTGEPYLYYAAAAIDAAQAGQDFSNGEDLSGILSAAAALSAGITGGTGGTLPLGTTPPPNVVLTPLQIAAQAINIGAEAVGGVYGVVRSAENGNGAGILAGALEAAAAAAAGVGMASDTQTQIYSTVSAALALSSVATNVGSDFANGYLAQGLVDSLNGILPAVALADSIAQTNQSNLVMNSAAFVAAEAAPVVALPQSAAPPAGAVGLTQTVQGATNTIYLAPASSASPGQTAGNAPLIVQIVPDATATPGVDDGTVSLEQLSAAINLIGEAGLNSIGAGGGSGGDGVPGYLLKTAANGKFIYSDEVTGPYSNVPLTLTSPYGAPRGGDLVHSGVDLAPPKINGQVVTDAEALSVTSGTVVRTGATGFGPNAVIVQTPEGNWAVYGHLNSESVKIGDFVTPGTPIGVIGDQGLVFPAGVAGTHLHFQIMTGAMFGPNARYLGVPNQ